MDARDRAAVAGHLDPRPDLRRQPVDDPHAEAGALVGIKMLIHDFLPHNRTSEITLISLAVIAVALAIGIGVSLAIPEPPEKPDEGEPA